MDEQERRDRLERLDQCIKLGEDAYDQLDEPRTHSSPAGHYSDAKDFFGEAIGLARGLGLEAQAETLSERLAHIKAVYRSQFAGADSWPPLDIVWQEEPEPLARPVSPEELAEQLRQIRSNAALVVSTCQDLSGFELSYDLRSVEWIDGYIDRLRTTALSDAEQEQLISNFGSYLGEAILAAYGGAWSLDGFGWHICFDEENRAYPFSKVGKHFRFGAEDSIAVFYRSIAAFWPS